MDLEKMYNNETNNFVLSDTDDIYNFVSEHEEEIIDLFKRGAYTKSFNGYQRCIKDFCMYNDIHLNFENVTIKDLIYEIDWSEADAELTECVDKLEDVFESISEFINNYRSEKVFSNADVKTMLENWSGILEKLASTLY
ncbi:MAG: hypothetical protein BWY04_01332 [candidate division CPR1 bacterium ADurb.Bin160]|uniref:Uncharacterized protein n=1 Tax=candidate division CPR1 bacterium ADurb.Bin160 TaxID=1852826 RepID=A0A1V5ZJV7_9BACT|nr:MAG: hypothetical protein BWY04_01332 [candidate division CPR1 bacterium ADurb.Bin160]